MSDLLVPIPVQLQGEQTIDVALVLGSGLSEVASRLERPTVVPYGDIPDTPHPGSQVVGHAGRLMIGALGSQRVCVFQGRFHQYQDLSALGAAYPARLAAALGAKTLIVTNASGGVNPDLRTGDLVLVSDQVNLTGSNPLIGWPGPPGGTPFVSMTGAYDVKLRETALDVAAELGVRIVKSGVYFGLLGPTYETPAEVAMLRALGADIVGMSTVPEVIVARALGMRVLGVSLVTNQAAGADLSHEEVLEVGRRAAADLERLVLGILQRLQ